jgi:hypothetical protein
LDGVSVTIPPNALTGDSTVKLGRQEGSLDPVLGTANGPILDLASDLEQFYQAVSIRMPYAGSGHWPVPYCIDPTGQLQVCDLIAVDPVASACVFQTFHTGQYCVVSEPEPGQATASSAAGKSASLFSGTYVTDYEVPDDGFQIGNEGSLYHSVGECLGMVAFAQWYHREKKASGGSFFPRFMQPVGTRQGQQVIATRAHTSIDTVWWSYLPGMLLLQNGLVTDSSAFLMIRNAIANTNQPVCLHITSAFSTAIPKHAVLAYAVHGQQLSIYDPNMPGVSDRKVVLTGSPPGFDDYNSFGDIYSNFFLVGDGSLYVAEPYRRILKDAEEGFNGSNDAQVHVTSHSNGATVSEANVLLKGTVGSGDVAVQFLDLLVNGTQSVRASFIGNSWEAYVVLATGDNYIEFITRGLIPKLGTIPIPNTQTERFKLVRGAPPPPGNGSLEIQLTRTPADSNLDLYVSASNGGTWYYLQPAGCDGGITQADIWSPQIWFMPAGEHPDCPPPYTVRVHNSGSAAASFQARITYNRGTPSETSTTVNGQIQVGDFFNHDPGSTGPDWADVGVYTPVDP